MTSCALSTLSFQGSGQRQKRCEFWSVARPSFWKHAKHIAIKKQIANSTRKEWYDVKFYIFSHCPNVLSGLATRMYSSAQAELSIMGTFYNDNTDVKHSKGNGNKQQHQQWGPPPPPPQLQLQLHLQNNAREPKTFKQERNTSISIDTQYTSISQSGSTTPTLSWELLRKAPDLKHTPYDSRMYKYIQIH